MRFFKFSVLSVLICGFMAAATGCSPEEIADNRDTTYGYVQFKLYKAASYEGTKAIVDELDSLYQASKIEVRLRSAEGQAITQTLTLSASDADAAEYGLRSSKLRVIAGGYSIISFVLYDGKDEQLYLGGTPADAEFTVVPGGLTVHDLTAQARERGFVRFRLMKDISCFTQTPGTKSSVISRQYTFDEISEMNITVQAMDGTYRSEVFRELPVDFSVHFASSDVDGNEVDSDKASGYRTSSAVCDTLLRIDGGDYQIVSYEAFDENGTLLETRTYETDERPAFTVTDNRETVADLKISLREADAYIQDYYALYAIWKALDGENWSYDGETYTKGCNWNFNKDPDLWGDQPGVEIHANGRVAKIDISGYGIKGVLPAAIGTLTELVELHLGSHNEIKQYWTEDPVRGTYVNASAEEKAALRMQRHRAFTDAMHPAIQTSAPIALALREHNISINAISAFDNLSKDEISAMAASGRTPANPSGIVTFDMNTGKMTNGLTGIDPAINNLRNLETLFIANSPITAAGFPTDLSGLESLTDLEIYNCPNLGRMPEAIAQLPALIQVNLSNNDLGKGDDSDKNAAYEAVVALATGAAKDQIQMIYMLYNHLRTIPTAELAGMSKLGLIDFSHNAIHGTIPAFGHDFSPVEVYIDNNQIEAFENTSGDFWNVDDLDVFSANYNLLTEFPNIFTADTDYSLSSISLGYNQISSIPAGFKGVRTETLTLTRNNFETFPKEILGTEGQDSFVNYILLNANGMKDFPEDCFLSKYSSSLISLDLTYNDLTKLPDDFTAETFPYLYGVDISYNNFDEIPVGPLNSPGLTVYGVRGQRDENGNRTLRKWYTGIYNHTGLRGLFVGSNDLRDEIADDTISYLIYYFDISDNPNITFDASDICYYWQLGAYILYYDKTQNILNCDAMLE